MSFSLTYENRCAARKRTMLWPLCKGIAHPIATYTYTRTHMCIWYVYSGAKKGKEENEKELEKK